MTRWRVILVRVPPASAASSPHGITGARFTPTVLKETTDEAEARDFAARFYEEGASVALLGEPAEGGAVCRKHPEHLAGRDCRRCGAPVCAECRLEAEGDRLCQSCFRARVRERRNRRLRILFAVFVFAVFLQQTWAFLRREAQLLNAHGPIRALIVQFAAVDQFQSPLLQQLNDPSGPHSLATVGTWYDAEHRRYTNQPGRFLDLTVRGPFAADLAPPSLGEPEDPWWRLALRAWQYPRYFHEQARAVGIEPDQYAVRLYVTYTSEGGDVEAESRGSRKGRVAVAHLSVDETNPGYALLTAAHEIGHILGADDHYDPDTYLAVFPDGIAEPQQRPLYPQHYAEVMTGDIPMSATDEAEVQSLDEVRVGYRTAAEFGWISQEQADLKLGAPPRKVPVPSDPAAEGDSADSGITLPPPPPPATSPIDDLRLDR